MKSCPTCARTFEDTLTYCLIDGSILSAPSDSGKRDEDRRATEILRSNEPPADNQTAPPPEPTIPAIQPAAVPLVGARKPSIRSEQKPVLLPWIIGGITLFLVFGIAFLAFLNGQAMAPTALLMLARRSPLFLLFLGGIIFAIVRKKRHPRVSLMTVLALIILTLEGVLFSFFVYWLPQLTMKMSLSAAALDWFFGVVFFCEDFVFAAVIILLVAATFIGRRAQLATTD